MPDISVVVTAVTNTVPRNFLQLLDTLYQFIISFFLFCWGVSFLARPEGQGALNPLDGVESAFEWLGLEGFIWLHNTEAWLAERSSTVGGAAAVVALACVPFMSRSTTSRAGSTLLLAAMTLAQTDASFFWTIAAVLAVVGLIRYAWHKWVSPSSGGPSAITLDRESIAVNLFAGLLAVATPLLWMLTEEPRRSTSGSNRWDPLYVRVVSIPGKPE